MNYKIVIPARYASTRLPGKLLRDCLGKPVLRRVYEQAVQASADEVVIATDDERIQAAAREFGANVIMTDISHRSGSDRIAEAISLLGWNDECLVVNLQGDEPLMPPACLDQVAELLHENPQAAVATLWWPVSSVEQYDNPNAVKLVTSNTGRALYFSRASIPGGRSSDPDAWKLARRHIGLYAYRAGKLRELCQLPPGILESEEHLEQLRWLETGHEVVASQACEPVPAGVDTEEDLLEIQRLLESA
jgi:3-deoxy-manno-octulosonate cytidylyltransferase (CMP-KDO synthetase)